MNKAWLYDDTFSRAAASAHCFQCRNRQLGRLRVRALLDPEGRHAHGYIVGVQWRTDRHVERHGYHDHQNQQALEHPQHRRRLGAPRRRVRLLRVESSRFRQSIDNFDRQRYDPKSLPHGSRRNNRFIVHYCHEPLSIKYLELPIVLAERSLDETKCILHRHTNLIYSSTLRSSERSWSRIYQTSRRAKMRREIRGDLSRRITNRHTLFLVSFLAVALSSCSANTAFRFRGWTGQLGRAGLSHLFRHEGRSAHRNNLGF